MIERRSPDIKTANLQHHRFIRSINNGDGTYTVKMGEGNGYYPGDTGMTYDTDNFEEARQVEAAAYAHTDAHTSGDQKKIKKTDAQLPSGLQAHQD